MYTLILLCTSKCLPAAVFLSANSLKCHIMVKIHGLKAMKTFWSKLPVLEATSLNSVSYTMARVAILKVVWLPLNVVVANE